MMGYSRLNVSVLDSANTRGTTLGTGYTDTTSNSKCILLYNNTDKKVYRITSDNVTPVVVLTTTGFGVSFFSVHDRLFVFYKVSNGTGAKYTCLFSDDGEHWTTVNIPDAFSSAYGKRMYYMNDTFILINGLSTSDVIYISTDCVNWTFYKTVGNCTVAGDYLYMIDLNNRMTASRTNNFGTSTEVVTFSGAPSTVKSLIVFNAVYDGTGYTFTITESTEQSGGYVVYYSANGTSFARKTTLNLRNFVIAKNLIVSSMAGIGIYSSSDHGQNWTRRLSTSSTVYDIKYCDGVFVAITASGRYQSTNGTSWTQLESVQTLHMAYHKGLLLLVTYASSTYTTQYARFTFKTLTYNSLTTGKDYTNSSGFYTPENQLDAIKSIPSGSIATGKIHSWGYNQQYGIIGWEYIPMTLSTSPTGTPFVIKTKDNKYASPNATAIVPSVRVIFSGTYYKAAYRAAEGGRRIQLWLKNVAVDKAIKVVIQGTSSGNKDEVYTVLYQRTGMFNISGTISYNDGGTTKNPIWVNETSLDTGKLWSSTSSYSKIPVLEGRYYYDIFVYIERGTEWVQLAKWNSYNSYSNSGTTMDSIDITWTGTYEDVMFHV